MVFCVRYTKSLRVRFKNRNSLFFFKHRANQWAQEDLNFRPSDYEKFGLGSNELFIRQGIYPKEMSRILHHVFEMRQAGDYQKSKVITDEQALDVLTSANEFVETVQKKLSQGLQ